MKSLSAALAFVGLAQAGLRFPCSTLTRQRLDPVVQPGANPSSHLHHIVGGNAFNATMTGDVGARGTCTTCQMAEDFSNYWTAHLYFKDPNNGSYHRVMNQPVSPLLGGSQGAQGGITVYYTQFDLNKDNLASQPITTFKPVSPLALSAMFKYSPCLGIPYDSRRSNAHHKSTNWLALSMPQLQRRKRCRDA